MPCHMISPVTVVDWSTFERVVVSLKQQLTWHSLSTLMGVRLYCSTQDSADPEREPLPVLFFLLSRMSAGASG